MQKMGRWNLDFDSSFETAVRLRRFLLYYLASKGNGLDDQEEYL